MNFYLKLYFFFGVLALAGSCAFAYCLWQISPWALYAAMAGIGTRVCMWLQDEAWKDNLRWEALRKPFAAQHSSEEK
jgi:hypothetical protein